jgi:hypothetical protein
VADAEIYTRINAPSRARMTHPPAVDGSGIAHWKIVNLNDALVPCPHCHRTVKPVPESSLIVAWYECPCGYFWSRRIRNGAPAADDVSFDPLFDPMHTSAEETGDALADRR